MKSYKYFPEYELKCKCGKCDSPGEMDPDFMERLIALREELGPLRLTSAYRCPEYNNDVSMTGLDGPHTTGAAVDISCLNSSRRMKLVAAALRGGFSRIGVAKTFIHLDSLTDSSRFPQEVMWTY